MTELQNRIYQNLLCAGGRYVSGQELAESTGVTRAAVWKAVNALRKSGMTIEGQTNLGYCIIEKNILSADGIKKYLKTPDFYIVDYKSEVTSTNTVLKEEAFHGAPEGTVLAASNQTAGRGRYGRSFISSPSCGIYLSFILRPKDTAADTVQLTAMAAAASAAAIDMVCGTKTGIKWVNDIYLRGKKIVGILCEGSVNMESGTFDYIVVGIGVNILMPRGLPDEIKDKVGAVYDSSESAYENDAFNRVAAALLDEFHRLYATSADYMSLYKEKSIILGKNITVLHSSSCGVGGASAVAVDIDDKARLLVRYPDGSEEWLSSGEISIKL